MHRAARPPHWKSIQIKNHKMSADNWTDRRTERRTDGRTHYTGTQGIWTHGLRAHVLRTITVCTFMITKKRRGRPDRETYRDIERQRYIQTYKIDWTLLGSFGTQCGDKRKYLNRKASVLPLNEWNIYLDADFKELFNGTNNLQEMKIKQFFYATLDIFSVTWFKIRYYYIQLTKM